MATKLTKHKQKNNRPKLFEPEHFSGQIQTNNLCHPRRIRYDQAKCERDTTKFGSFFFSPHLQNFIFEVTVHFVQLL